MRQTYFAKKGEIAHRWRHVDAEGQRLGRLATQVAVVLMGKHRPEYTAHVDTGDYVVITNAEKIVLTGNKAKLKFRHHFTGYPGGQRMESYESLLERRPEVVLEDAIRRMLPKNRLGRQMLKKLKVYKGPAHPHQAQQPEEMAV